MKRPTKAHVYRSTHVHTSLVLLNTPDSLALLCMHAAQTVYAQTTHFDTHLAEEEFKAALNGSVLRCY